MSSIIYLLCRVDNYSDHICHPHLHLEVQIRKESVFFLESSTVFSTYIHRVKLCVQYSTVCTTVFLETQSDNVYLYLFRRGQWDTRYRSAQKWFGSADLDPIHTLSLSLSTQTADPNHFRGTKRVPLIYVQATIVWSGKWTVLTPEHSKWTRNMNWLETIFLND